MFTANEKELMMRNELRVIEEMKQLMECSEDDGLPVTFRELLLRCCRVLHTAVPRNPASYLAQARQCKGMRRMPLLLRYKYIGKYISDYIV